MTDTADRSCVIAQTDTDPVEQLRAASGASVVMVIDQALDATAVSIARAAISAVAVERAPATRINAIRISDRTDGTAIDRTVAFLHRSPAMTGQVVELAGISPAIDRTGRAP